VIPDPEKPLHLLLPVWGTPYIQTALDVCVATLMAPENLPALPNSVVVSVYTTPAGRAQLEASPLFALLAARAEVRFLAIDDRDRDLAKMALMSRGHLAGARQAYDASALTMFLVADTFHVAGSLPRLVEWAQRPNVRVVTSVAWGASAERFTELAAPLPGQPWSMSPRRAAGLAVEHMHSGYRCWDYEGPCFGDPRFPVSPWWRVAPDAVLTHSLAWATAMINYARVPEHNMHCLEKWTVDGDYAYRNAPEPYQWHVVTDSDDHIMLGLSPEANNSYDALPGPRIARADDPEAFKVMALRAARHNVIMDPLKRTLFMKPVLLHGSEVDERKVKSVRTRARRAVVRTSEPPSPETNRYQYPPQLLRSRDGINLVAYQDKILAVPQALGPLDLDQPEARALPGVQTFSTEQEAEAALWP
jgi:hypothetical protein